MLKKKKIFNRLVVFMLLFSLLLSNTLSQQINVNAASKRVVRKLSVNKTSVVLNKGETKKIKYKVFASSGANKKIKIKNSDKNIISVKVKKGKIYIKAKNKGKATISVITKAKNKKGKHLRKKIYVLVNDLHVEESKDSTEEITDQNNEDKKTPTNLPTKAPTARPTKAPTARPTEAPTARPTEAPTARPTEAPTARPTEAPTARPTETPTSNPTATPTPIEKITSISYQAHSQNHGWMPVVKDGETAGTVGEGYRLEGIKIHLKDKNGNSIVRYRTHVQNEGWQSWKKSGELSGTEGKERQIEGVSIELISNYINNYDIYYRVHVTNFGWLGWAKNGEIAGSEGLSLRMEAIQIKIVKKGVSIDVGGIHMIEKPSLTYQAHSQSDGWKNSVVEGKTAGTTGENKRLEGLKINLNNFDKTNGIEYRAHVSEKGWLGWNTSGQIAGTTGEARAIEAVQIKLVGNVSKYFDIYYRMHVSNMGWLGWAKNGETAGTTGGGVQAEAIEIKLICKGVGFDVGGTRYIDCTQTGIHLQHYMTQSLKQPYSGPCCAYAYGIGLSIVLKQNVNPMQFYYDGLAHYDWGRVGAYHSYNATEIYNALKNGKPTMVHYTYSGGQHWVLIVGIKNGANINNIQYSDFICIDSATGSEYALTSAYRFGNIQGIKVFN